MTIKGAFAALSDNGVMPKCTLYLLQTCHKTWVVLWLLHGPHGAHLFYSFLILSQVTPFLCLLLRLSLISHFMCANGPETSLECTSSHQTPLFFAISSKMHHFLGAKNHYHCSENLKCHGLKKKKV